MNFSGLLGTLKEGKLTIRVNATQEQRSEIIDRLTGVMMVEVVSLEEVACVILILHGFLPEKSAEVTNLSIQVKEGRVIIDENLKPGSRSALVSAKQLVAA